MKSKTRKILAIIMTVAMCFSMFTTTAFADSEIIVEGTAGEGVTWVLDGDGTLTLSGEGAIVIEDDVTPWEEYNGSIIKVVVEEGITEIPALCFAYSNGIEKIIISDTVKTIGDYAFYASMNIYTLIIGSGVETIGADIVNYTESLYRIHYKGTQQSWESIEISEENDELYNREIHFITDELKGAVEPSCADGKTAGLYCGICDENLTGEVIPAVYEHDYETTVIEPKCTEEGYTEYECGVCGDWYTDDYTEPTGHNLGNDGLCTICGEKCDHIDEKVNGVCDFCEYTFDYAGIDVDDVKTAYVTEEHGNTVVEFTPTVSGWYAVISDNGGDDENIDPYVDVYDASGEYVASDDDSDYEDTYNFYCAFEAEAGETYFIVVSAYNFDVEFDYVVTKHVGVDHQPTSGEPYVTLTWNAEGEYQWYLIEIDYTEGTYNLVELVDETEATLKNPQIGSMYICAISYNGIIDVSNPFEYTYAISHQPTAAEPYVELNDDTDATYQWYSAKEAVVELTDENAECVEGNDSSSSYSEEKGWAGIDSLAFEEGDYAYYWYFIVPLKAGDVLTVELTGDFVNMVTLEGIYDYIEIEVDDKNVYEFQITEDDYYVFAAFKATEGEDVFVKAYVNGYECTAIDGATDAEYNTTKEGLYICEVTFADGTTEMSDVYKMADGWELENGKWVYYQKGIKATNRWVKDSKGWCYVDADGYCVTNCWKKDSKGWCYLDANGRMATNKWVKDSKGWCYLGADGYAVTNCWKKDSKGWCYLDANGRMATNRWVKDSKGWCYVGADGYCVTNCWKKDSKGWCYLDANGRMATNKWIKDSKGWCYVGANGYCLKNSWVKSSKGWYYLDANGYMVTGTKVIDGKTYKFNSDGLRL